MKIIGFTGSRDLTEAEKIGMERILYRLHPDTVITGACVGVDEFVATWFASHEPGVRQLIYVPGNRSRVNMRVIEDLSKFSQVEVSYMPRSSSYLDRNLAIIASCDFLLGFPRHVESHALSQRSGTWQTIRKARALSKPMRVFVLSDGTFDESSRK